MAPRTSRVDAVGQQALHLTSDLVLGQAGSFSEDLEAASLQIEIALDATPGVHERQNDVDGDVLRPITPNKRRSFKPRCYESVIARSQGGRQAGDQSLVNRPVDDQRRPLDSPNRMVSGPYSKSLPGLVDLLNLGKVSK